MRTNFLRFIWVLALILLPGAAFAQDGLVEGVVLTPEGEALPGANVALEGTTFGTATDVQGRFSFAAPSGSYNFLVSFVGYADYSAPVVIRPGETLNLRVQLVEGGIDLDEVVVTALGIERETRSLGYSVSEVESDEVNRAAESNLVNALAGKVAGVQITSSSGQPGRGSRIQIRGISSLLGENQPLFVVDGVPISNAEDANLYATSVRTGGMSNRAVDIDPNIIQDITILKGAAATALYGSRATNGAVLITTKGGLGTTTAGAGPRVSYRVSGRWDEAIIDGYQNKYAAGTNGIFYNNLPASEGGYRSNAGFGVTGQTNSSWGPAIDSLNFSPSFASTREDLGFTTIPVYDPRDQFYETGNTLEQSVSVTGGGVGNSYFLSFTNLDQGGIVPTTDLKRTSVLAKFSGELSPKLRAEASANYIRTENNTLSEGNGAAAFTYGLNFAPITFDLTNYLFPDETQRSYSNSFNNPFWLTKNSAVGSDVDRIIGSAQMQYKILPWLSIAERLGIDTYTDARKQTFNLGFRGVTDGAVFDNTFRRREINSDLTVTADRQLSPKFALNAVLGNNINRRQNQYNYLNGRGLGIPGYYNIGNASNVTGNENIFKRGLTSVYGQATLDYDQLAYLTVTGRNDWSSTLPKDNNSYFYPSASVSLVFTELINTGTWMDFGKLRASVAQIGSDTSPYQLQTIYTQAAPGDGQGGNIDFPFMGVNGFVPSNTLLNPALKPELSTEYEVGADLQFFSNRISLDVAYYNRSTKDQIFNVPLAPSTGYVSRNLNAGEVRNRGGEVSLSLAPVRTRDLFWDVQVNWSKNVTDVVELAPGVENIFLYGFTTPQIRIMPETGGYGAIWGSQWARNDNGQLLIDSRPTLSNGAANVNYGLPLIADEDGALGYVQPDWLANIRTGVTFKGLSVNALLDIRHGGDLLNFDRYYTTYYGIAKETENREGTINYGGVNAPGLPNEGEANNVEVPTNQAYFQSSRFGQVFENFVEDGSFIKLREVSLGYTLPSTFTRRYGVENMSIIGTGRNLWIGTDFTGGDPEGSLAGTGNAQGFYHMVTPNTRSFQLTLQLTL